MHIKKIIFYLLLFTLFPIISYAEYIGPITVIEGRWGSSDLDFGFEPGDTADSFPGIIDVDALGNIIIGDGVNYRIKIYNTKGVWQRNFTYKEISVPFGGWPVNLKVKAGIGIFSIYEKLQKYDYKGNLIWAIAIPGTRDYWVTDDGSIILQDINKIYHHYSSNGKYLQTYDVKPLELGIVEKNSTENDISHLKITYAEKKYSIEITEYSPEDKISRDIGKNLYIIQRRVKIINKDTEEKDYFQYYIVNRIDNCSNIKILLDMPENKHEVVGYDPAVGKRKKALELYGEPVISPNGDVYTWKYTPEKYSILKWTWQGPEDAPQSLQILAGVAGLKLDWQKPIKDVETVSGYQILRSSEVCGPFTEVTTAKKDKFIFEDRTIKPPWKYYYVVKAVRDKKYSSDSNKVYMQWK